MEKLSILTADILDILFEGRNKGYGAYDLRKTYHTRIVYALAGTVFICLLFIGGSILASAKKINNNQELVTNIELENFKSDEPQPVPPPPPVKQDLPKVAMIVFTPPKIVNEEIKQNEEMKPVDMLEETRIGPMNQEGVKGDDVIAPPVDKTTRVAKTTLVEDETEGKFYGVQIAAEFIGGIGAWRKYLERNLNKDLPSENGAPIGSYTVTVSFMVDKTGAISDVKAENDPGYGTREEAIRVIKKGPNWKPAIQNGREVIYRHKQNITFRVSED